MKMRHPLTGGTADTDKAAFDEVWKDLGWELVEEESEHGYAPGSSPAELAAEREAEEAALRARLETGTTPDGEDVPEEPTPAPDDPK